jgi:basic amino acid/polyamine antiporter, APA family
MSNTTTHQSKKLSLSMATSIGVKAIIGVGLFTAPVKLQIAAGPAGIITYALVSIAALFMALAIARVAQLYPEKGAFYTYAKAWGGHVWGVIATLSYMIGLVIALGLLAFFAGLWLHNYIPFIGPTNLSLILIFLIVMTHLAGAQMAKTGQKILLILTYIPIILITLLCLFKADTNNLIPFFPYGWQSIFTAVPVVIFGFFGFEAIPSLFTDIEKPERNVPLAIIWTMLLVGLTYIVFTGSIFIGLPREFFVDAQTPLSGALLQLYPNFTWLVTLIDWAIIITVIGVLHAMTWSLSALALDTSNLIAPRIELSKKNALIIIGIFTALSCLIFQNAIDLMFSLVSLNIVFAYATAMIVLLLQPKGRSLYQIIIALLGLSTAILIFGCGLMGVFAAY